MEKKLLDLIGHSGGAEEEVKKKKSLSSERWNFHSLNINGDRVLHSLLLG